MTRIKGGMNSDRACHATRGELRKGTRPLSLNVSPSWVFCAMVAQKRCKPSPQTGLAFGTIFAANKQLLPFCRRWRGKPKCSYATRSIEHEQQSNHDNGTHLPGSAQPFAQLRSQKLPLVLFIPDYTHHEGVPGRKKGGPH